MNLKELMVDIDVTQDSGGGGSKIAGPGTNPKSSRGTILEVMESKLEHVTQ